MIAGQKTDYEEVFVIIGSTFSRRLRGKSMYHMTRGCDESSRLVTEAVPSSSAPNLTIDTEPPQVEVRPTTYGSIENTVTTDSMNSETEPLIDYSDDSHRKQDPKV